MDVMWKASWNVLLGFFKPPYVQNKRSLQPLKAANQSSLKQKEINT